MRVNLAAYGLLDRLPAAARHYLIMFVASILAWAATAVLDLQVTGNPVTDGIMVSAATTGIAQLALWWTKLTEQYGTGAETPVEPSEPAVPADPAE